MTRILVVDDEPQMVKLVTSILKRSGFQDVDATVTAEEALIMTGKKIYDVIISDLHMKSMNGLHLLRKVRARTFGVQPRFIMMTASARHSDVVASKHGGIDAYLLKPFTPAQLKEKLRDAVRG